MENKKRLAAIAFVAALVVAFVGASAFRYFTVVVPEQQAAQQAEEQAEQEREQARENIGVQPDAEQDADGEEASETVASYSGAMLDLFTVLDNFTWYEPGNGGYAEFGQDGTVSTGTQRAAFAPRDFTILAVEGDLESAEGATAIVQVGDEYGTMRFVQNSADTAASFAESPESDFKFHCPLIGEGSYYKLPDAEVAVDGYENGAPDAVLAHRAEIDAAVSDVVEAELPAVSRATWNKEASISYAEADASIVLMYECNDPRGTVVTLVYTPSTGACQVFVGNDQDATAETQISAEEGFEGQLPEGAEPIPQEAGEGQAAAQRQWEEALAQEQAAEQAESDAAVASAADGEEAQR